MAAFARAKVAMSLSFIGPVARGRHEKPAGAVLIRGHARGEAPAMQTHLGWQTSARRGCLAMLTAVRGDFTPR